MSRGKRRQNKHIHKNKYVGFSKADKFALELGIGRPVQDNKRKPRKQNKTSLTYNEAPLINEREVKPLDRPVISDKTQRSQEKLEQKMKFEFSVKSFDSPEYIEYSIEPSAGIIDYVGKIKCVDVLQTNQCGPCSVDVYSPDSNLFHSLDKAISHYEGEFPQIHDEAKAVREAFYKKLKSEGKKGHFFEGISE